jgi:hypothetical protein
VNRQNYQSNIYCAFTSFKYIVSSFKSYTLLPINLMVSGCDVQLELSLCLPNRKCTAHFGQHSIRPFSGWLSCSRKPIYRLDWENENNNKEKPILFNLLLLLLLVERRFLIRDNNVGPGRRLYLVYNIS